MFCDHDEYKAKAYIFYKSKDVFHFCRLKLDELEKIC